MILKIQTCLLLVFIWGSSLAAQSNFLTQPTFTISVFSHSIGIPFKDYFKTPINLGMTLGVEFDYNSSRSGQLIQRLELGWHRHRHLNTALWVKTDFIRRFSTKDGGYGELQAGLGYIRDFSYYETFEKNEQGIYQPTGNKSKGGFLADIGIGAGYQIDVNNNYSLSPFIRYEGMVQFPYAKLISVFPQSLLHIGSRVGI